MAKKIQESLSKLLSLPRIIPRLIGFNDIMDVLKHLDKNNCREYENTEGRSNYLDAIISYKPNIEPPFNLLNDDLLQIYDDNIKNHLDIINKKRTLTINLKPFQYLSLLFTEIFLDLKFKDLLLEFLNAAIECLNEKRTVKFDEYTKEDLEKACFWMATGSGKTIIMHINYLQYLHYAKKHNKEINNVILLTPNEDLSKQHEKELQLSTLPGLVANNLNARMILGDKDLIGIKILDFNKIRDKQAEGRSQKDKGVTIDYRSFGKNNLILVDEGHRGTKGNTWLEMRNKIAKEGFTFEYSATFHDVMEKKTKDNSNDYKKTILFDYSYKYFYNEGYGKDYDISNLPNKDDLKTSFFMMLGNLLSFYEQKRFFLNNQDELENNFNIENPLWILVGSSVNPKKDDDKLDEKTKSDIQKFIVFLSDLKTKKSEVINKIDQILNLKTNIKNIDTNEDFFKGKFEYLKKILTEKFKEDQNKLLEDIYKIIFYTKSDAGLILSNIKNSDGEIGLRYADNKKPFGLIYIGKGSEGVVIDDVIKKHEKIQRIDQEVGYSFFQTLNKKDDKPLNLLIGAKKFIEGWDNFRISSMLLLNFAKGKGASAIQLFGRGVRLKGHNFSMKRSGSLSLDAPKDIEVIETLNIFGIHADYMQEFKDEIEEQGEINYIVEKKIVVHNYENELAQDIKEGLYYIREKKGLERDFKENHMIIPDESLPITVRINTSTYIASIKSKSETYTKAGQTKIHKKDYYDNYANFVDWNKIYSNVLRYKKIRSYNNFYLDSLEEIKQIFTNEKLINIEILGEKESFDISNKKTFEEIQEFKTFLEDLYSDIIKNFIKKTWTAKLRKLSESSLELDSLKDQDIIPYYTIRIEVNKHQEPVAEGPIKEIIQKLLDAKSAVSLEEIDIEEEDIKDFIKKEQTKDHEFMIEFNKHLYFPLLIANEKGYSLSPTGLNEGEGYFVNELKKYLVKNDSVLKDKKIILLRNHENKGTGFYLETEKFYYDFILWVIEEDLQKIYFLDPKGLVHVDKEKRDFNKDGIISIEKSLKLKEKDKKFELGCYIISQTHPSQIGDDKIKDSLVDYNVYYKDNITQLFDKILA